MKEVQLITKPTGTEALKMHIFFLQTLFQLSNFETMCYNCQAFSQKGICFDSITALRVCVKRAKCCSFMSAFIQNGNKNLIKTERTN